MNRANNQYGQVVVVETGRILVVLIEDNIQLKPTGGSGGSGSDHLHNKC